MRELVSDIIYIINNYNSYYKGITSSDAIEERFIDVQTKMKIYLKEYDIEYNNILGKPNKPFIPLFAIRDNRRSKHMTKGIYVALLIKRSEGIYVSLNQGTENRRLESIIRDKEKFRRRVNDIIATYDIEYKQELMDNINLTSNIMGNLKRPKSYEAGNIKAIFYDINTLEKSPEKFLRDILWFVELYRKLFLK